MSTNVRSTIRALLRDMGETSYADLADRTTSKLASDLMEMVGEGEVLTRVPSEGGARLFSLAPAAVAEEADAPANDAPAMGIVIYNSTGSHKPYWLVDDEPVEARYGSDEIFMEADPAIDVGWGKVRGFRVRSDHPVYRGDVIGVYADHGKWGPIPIEEAIWNI